MNYQNINDVHFEDIKNGTKIINFCIKDNRVILVSKNFLIILDQEM